MFIQNILKGIVDTKDPDNHEYQLSNRDNPPVNFNIHKKLLRRRSERGKLIHNFVPSTEAGQNIPSINLKSNNSINY